MCFRQNAQKVVPLRSQIDFVDFRTSKAENHNEKTRRTVQACIVLLITSATKSIFLNRSRQILETYAYEKGVYQIILNSLCSRLHFPFIAKQNMLAMFRAGQKTAMFLKGCADASDPP